MYVLLSLDTTVCYIVPFQKRSGYLLFIRYHNEIISVFGLYNSVDMTMEPVKYNVMYVIYYTCVLAIAIRRGGGGGWCITIS